MDITEKQVKRKRRIGSYNGKPVTEVVTKGGLHVIALDKNGKSEIVAMGPHPGFARIMAENKNPGITFLELSKSQQVDPKAAAALMPKYEALMAVCNQAFAKLKK